MNRAVELNTFIGQAVLVIMNLTGTLYEYTCTKLYTHLTHCMLSQHQAHSLLLINNMCGLQSWEAEEYIKDCAIIFCI